MKRLFSCAAFLLAAGVIFGAFGAHALRPHLSPREMEIYQTAVFYQITQSLGVLIILLAAAASLVSLRTSFFAAKLILGGITLFSGSLYALVLTGVTKFGMITPLGGASFIGAWCLIGWSAFGKSEQGDQTTKKFQEDNSSPKPG